MSSSRQNAPRTSELGRRGKALPCPECGALAMVRVKKVMRFSDGLVVPKLDRFQCGECGANFFDDDAMGVIERTDARSAAQVHTSS